MRGPADEAIETAAPEGATAKGAKETLGQLPGGKPLARLLQLLESAGYTDTAQQLVESAIDAPERKELSGRAKRFTANPEGKPAIPTRRRAAPKKSGDPGEAEVPAASIAETQLEVAQITGPPQPTGPQWRSLGPWTVPNGQTYGSSRVNVSGRIAAIAVDPSNPAHVLAGAAGGGVWESFDRGGSWSPRTDYAPTLTVGALAFDRQHPARVYCGTGEGNFYGYLGAGILGSTNGGTTWSSLCTAPFVGQGFYDLLVDPADSQHLLAATTGGLYVSTDGGVTWTRRRAATTWSLSMAPAGGPSAQILAACTDGLYRSTNGGTSWTAVSLPGAPASFNRLAVSIAPSSPGVAYVWGASGGSAYLWRRAQKTWHAVPAPPGVNVNQAWYDWFVAAAPDRANQVYCGAIDSYRGDVSGTTWTWTNLSSKSSGDSIHPDQHAIAFEPGNPDMVYIGCDGGLYRSPNRGVNWTHCNNGLVISEFEYLAHDYGSSRWLIGGTQDNGTERWTGSAIWEHVADGDGGDCGVNRTNPRTVFHTYYGMSPDRSTTGGNFGSWSYIPPPVPSGEGSLFYPPFECSATNGDTIAMGGDALYVSRNNGSAWTRIAFPAAARSSAMYLPNADTVYVGTTDGRVYRTQWSGSAWGALTALGTPRSAYLSDLFVDAAGSRLWATFRTIGGARVYRSDNGGSSWSDQTGNLPNLPVNAVEVDPWNSNRVWVATDLGVYQTTSGGTSWADFSNALPNVYVGDLLFHPHARVLRAATRNRGVWEIPVDGWLTQPICGRQWTGSLAGNAQQRWFTYNWPATWHVVWTVIPTSPRPGSPQLTWSVQVERASAEYVTYWITVTNLTPDPLTLDGRFCILSRY
jgi:ligand-binding sensor domain-containing protein